MGRSFPTGDGVGIIEEVTLLVERIEFMAYAVCGSPAQAVSHAILELTSRKPDLCVCGINYGENLGPAVLTSGTIGAALEASTYRIPSLAMNLEASINARVSSDLSPVEWRSATYFTTHFANLILKEGLPDNVSVLNVNIPSNASSQTPIRM